MAMWEALLFALTAGTALTSFALWLLAVIHT
jgi:hypothetical protein